MQNKEYVKDCEAKENQTKVEVDYKGSSIMYARCKNCGQPFTCPTDRTYNFCGYCGLRILWQE